MRPPTVGFVGAGQLARMAQQAAIPLGIDLHVLAEAPTTARPRSSPTSSSATTARWTTCARSPRPATSHLRPRADRPAHLDALGRRGLRLRPGPAAKRFAQDKAYQRRTFARDRGRSRSRRSPRHRPSPRSPRSPTSTAGRWCSRRRAAATTAAGCGSWPTRPRPPPRCWRAGRCWPRRTSTSNASSPSRRPAAGRRGRRVARGRDRPGRRDPARARCAPRPSTPTAGGGAAARAADRRVDRRRRGHGRRAVRHHRGAARQRAGAAGRTTPGTGRSRGGDLAVRQPPARRARLAARLDRRARGRPW
jgi:hypothetical protein